MCKEKIELRKKISKKYKLKVMNKSDVIIGESIFLKYLSDTMDMPVAQLKEIRGKRTDVALKKIIFPYVSFVEPGFQKLMRLMQETVSSSQFLRNFVENMDTRLSTNELFDKFRDNNIRVQRIAQQKKSFSFSVQYNNIQIDYGVGGIHGCVKPGVYQSNFTHGILDIDVKSYYPNLFIQNRLHPKQMDQDTFIKVYSDIFQERVKAQKEGDKLTSDALKLALNGLFGKTGSDVSCFYDPNVFFAVTVNGQLLLTMLVERLVRQGASLLQVNTDGVTILYSYLLQDDIIKICKEWEVLTNLQLETVKYDKMIIGDVNNYIAVFKEKEVDKETYESMKKKTPHFVYRENNGKYYVKTTKCKGRFEFSDLPLHKNKSALIVPKAIYYFFIHNVAPEIFIQQNRNIFDYCIGVKRKGDWIFMETCFIKGVRHDRELQGVVRYYVSNKGCKLIKVNKADGRETRLEAGKWLQTEFNLYEIKPWDNYDVNDEYYLERVYKEIENISKLKEKSQLSLF